MRLTDSQLARAIRILRRREYDAMRTAISLGLTFKADQQMAKADANRDAANLLERIARRKRP